MPGGDFPVDGVAALTRALTARYPFLTPYWAGRMIRAYGTEAQAVLGDAQNPGDLGTDFGATLTEAEVKWLMRHEFATRAADVVWRRTKLGLRLSAEQIATLDAYMTNSADRATRPAAE